jgi:fatty acid desaturase
MSHTDSVFAVSIVPVVEIFSFVFFSGMYMVWKHQCLHVYAQEFEGGGDATWQKVFVFLMASLYIGEVLFVGFMGLKEAPIHSGLGLVPLIVTILFHRHLVRKVIVPLRYLSLEVAADVDLQDGELNSTNNSTSTPLFRQPALDPDQEERGPMPYRRNMETNHRVGGGTTV